MVLCANRRTREVYAFSIKPVRCPERVHESNVNYSPLMKEIKKRLIIFRKRAMLGLNIFAEDSAEDFTPK